MCEWHFLAKVRVDRTSQRGAMVGRSVAPQDSGTMAGHDDDSGLVVSASARPSRVNRVTANGLVITGHCWFECGAPATSNVGSTSYPKFACAPCMMSNRALNQQCRHPAMERAKQEWNDMKRRDESTYKHKVRSCRVRESPGMPGVASATERGTVIARYHQAVETYLEVNLDIPVMWMDQADYIYHQTCRGKSKEEAMEMWRPCDADPDISSIGQGDKKRVAVQGMPVTHGIHGKRQRRSVDSESGLLSQSDIVTAGQRLGFANQGVTLAENFAEVGGHVFRRGASAASGTSTDMVLPEPQPVNVTYSDIRTSGLQPVTEQIPASQPVRAEELTPRRARTADTGCIVGKYQGQTGIRHCTDMFQTWFRHGADMVQTWPGSDMVQIWLKHGSDMVETWPGSGTIQTCQTCSAMVDTWFRHGSDMVQTRFRHGPVQTRFILHGSDMVQTRFRHGPDMARTWPVSDIIQTWTRHGSDMGLIHGPVQTQFRHCSDMVQTWRHGSDITWFIHCSNIVQTGFGHGSDMLHTLFRHGPVQTQFG